ncbi:hypothetical protein TI39_contig342g00040 [Zymoseptoria brevis]|uniref:Uncharacterized protein n=1 Tax=Zymoseptoria brevis TaxID=1047168 RepID=A0A0F4GSB3_9PEZI|nr:hypothetical protein TI39_contig342g00040 [Zymoseptoria brevis]
MCYQPSTTYSGCGCPRPITNVVKCSEADLVDDFCPSLKPFEDRVGNRICRKHYQELVAAVKSLGKKNGLWQEARNAAKLDRLEEGKYSDGEETEEVSGDEDDGEDRGWDDGWPAVLYSGGLEEKLAEECASV